METKIIVLTNNLIVISQIDEVPAAIPGEPDCKLVNPFKVVDNKLQLWLDFTDQTELMIHSDSILTMVQPDKDQLDKYQTLTAKPSITVK